MPKTEKPQHNAVLSIPKPGQGGSVSQKRGTAVSQNRQKSSEQLDALHSQKSSSSVPSRNELPFLPLPVTALGKQITDSSSLQAFAHTRHMNKFPYVFVIEKSSQTDSKALSLFGPDFIERSNERGFHYASDVDEFTDEHTGAQGITILFPNGQHRSVDINHILHLDPGGILTRSLLKFNPIFFTHEFDEAEIRVKVASAFLLNAFGFTDHELATWTLEPLSHGAFSIGVHRTFIQSVENSYLDLATLMISWGADVHLPSDDDGLLAITKAQNRHNAEMIQLLENKERPIEISREEKKELQEKEARKKRNGDKTDG